MAYKFQLGRARLSGSIIVEEGLESDFATNISSSQDVLADQNVQAGADIYAGADIEAGAQLRALGDLYVASTSMQVGNAEFGGDVAVTGAVSAAELSGALEYKLGAGNGISMTDWRNDADGTIAVDETWLSGTIQGYLSMEADRFITYDGAGNFAMDETLFSGSSRGLLSVDLSSNGGRGSLSYDASNGVFSYEGVTQAEIRGDISVTDAGGDGSLTYNSSTGVITYTGPSATEVRDHLSVADTNSIDMKYSNGQFSADLILSGGASNDALQITAGGLDLKPTITGNRIIAGNLEVQGDLTVTGSLTYINTTNLEIEDRLIRLAKGDVSYVDGAGFEFEWGDSFKTAQVQFDQASNEDAFNSSLPIQAPHMKAATFHGELIGASRMDVVSKADTDTLEAGKVNRYTSAVAAGSAESVSLPGSPEIGQQIMFKAADISDGGSIEIDAGSALIDGFTSIYLESPYAAVTLVYVDTNRWSVF